jgi:nitrate reductase (NAD(P)H)
MSDESKDWWTDERYAIYDLNVNSAIVYPAHDEKLLLATAPEKYTLKGYAYGGGGRRVTRVEVSLDKGKSWRLASIDYPEDRYRDASEQDLYGGALDASWRETSFCWCFWDLGVFVTDLKDANDILVRAMDESMNLQPRDMYWSVLGMMNNPWFRIVIHDEGGSLRFEHPTQPALIKGGWMERIKKEGGDLLNGFWGEKTGAAVQDVSGVPSPAEIRMTKDGKSRTIGLDELRKHDTADCPWFVVNGEVFDGTGFLKNHPGGSQSIISAAGMDATEDFMAIRKHFGDIPQPSVLTVLLDSETAKAMMPEYHIGSLDEASIRALVEGPAAPTSDTPRPTFLDTRLWTKAVLHAKRSVSWDSRIFTFKLEHDEQEFGLPTGQHVMMRLRDQNTKENVIRSYTPISETTAKGYLDVLVKIYFDTKEKVGGRMTKAMDALPIGHSIDFKGPIGKFRYLGRGRCAINGNERTVKSFYMICGGSGITPIFQILRAVMQDQEDTTSCAVLDGNRLLEDILCREELDYFAEKSSHKCKVLYALTKGPEDWTGVRGRIGPELLKEHCGLASDALVLICGPEPLERAAQDALSAQGWPADQILFF